MFLPFYLFFFKSIWRRKQWQWEARESQTRGTVRWPLPYSNTSQFNTLLLYLCVTHQAQHCDCPFVPEQVVGYSSGLPLELCSHPLHGWTPHTLLVLAYTLSSGSTLPPSYLWSRVHLSSCPPAQHLACFLIEFAMSVIGQSICLILLVAPTVSEGQRSCLSCCPAIPPPPIQLARYLANTQ